jgi:hypothetical protein
VILSGTGNPEHLEANIASFSRPPLPQEDLSKLKHMFRNVDSVSGHGLFTHHFAPPSTVETVSRAERGSDVNSYHGSRRHVSPVEQGGVPHRSSRPQQVRPAGRLWPIITCGTEKSFSSKALPQLGHTGEAFVPERTNTSTCSPQFLQSYS